MVTVVRSMRTLILLASQPSPSRPRVPTRHFVTPALKQLGDHGDVDARTPIAATAADDVEAVFFTNSSSTLNFLVGEPFDRRRIELRRQVVVDQHRGSGHQHGIEPVRFVMTEQHAERRQSPRRLLRRGGG